MEGVVRLDVATGLVQREHQLADELLAVAMLRDELFQFRDDLGVAAEREVGFDPLLERVEPEPGEAADLVLHARLEREVCERLTAPERERFAKRPRALGRRLRPRTLAKALEAREVELVRVE